MTHHPSAHALTPTANRDDRKSAAPPQSAKGKRGTVLHGFAQARDLLRNHDARQAGFMADLVTKVSVARAPILYQYGADHRRQRSATARFFAPRVVTTAYRALMERTSDALVASLQTAGRANLDDLGLDLAVTIAAEIVGLTDSDRAAMARRLNGLVSGMPQGTSPWAMVLGHLSGQIRVVNFLLRDVRPAVASRRRAPRQDVISHLLGEGYSDREILTECLTYAAAGMITTREFITMAGWHLLEDAALRNRFLAGGEGARIAILEEILRLEPVIGMLYRRVAQTGAEGPGEVVALDLRGANSDEAMVGRCPHRLDPDRSVADKVGGAGLAFGDGEHRCPGAQVALQEAAIFLDRLLRVPGVRLVRPPDMGWNGLTAGYELRGALLACGEAQ